MCADPAGILGVRRLLLLGSDTRPSMMGICFQFHPTILPILPLPDSCF